MACSSGNTQPWDFLVVRRADTKREIQKWMRAAMVDVDKARSQLPEDLVDSVGRSVTGHAAIESLLKVPILVLVFWNPDRGIRLRNEYGENRDGTLKEMRVTPGGRGASLYPACQNMMLAATSLGIGSLFATSLGLVDSKIKDLLGVPARMFLEAGIYLGYKDEKLGPPRRRPLTTCTHVDRWETWYAPPRAEADSSAEAAISADA
jgi:nitroreductase